MFFKSEFRVHHDTEASDFAWKFYRGASNINIWYVCEGEGEGAQLLASAKYDCLGFVRMKVKVRSCWRVPNMIASDLSGFRHSPLWQSQQCNEVKQDSSLSMAEAVSNELSAMYNWRIISILLVRNSKVRNKLNNWGNKEGKKKRAQDWALRNTRMTYRWIRRGWSYANNLRPIIEIWREPCKSSTRYAKASWEPREQDIVIYGIKGCTQIKWDE